MHKLLQFPNPVNEYAARSVAGMVVLLSIATLVFQSPWLLWALALGSMRDRLASPAGLRSIDAVAGVALLVLGLRMLL